MAVRVGGIVATMGADAAPFVRAFTEAERATRTQSAKIARTLRQVDRSMGGLLTGARRVGSSIGVALKGLTGVTGPLGIVGGVGVGSFAAASAGAAKFADSLAKTADRLSFSVEGLQELNYTAGRFGVSQNDVERAAARLQLELGKLTTEGATPAAKALETLGLQNRAMAGAFRDTEGLFRASLDALSNVTNEAERAALAARLFGREAGPKLANLIEVGSAAIDREGARARELGLILEERLARQAESANDALADLGLVLTRNVQRGLLNAAPLIEDVAKQLTVAVPRIIEFGKAWAEWFGVIDRAPVDRLKSLGAQIQNLEQYRDQINAGTFDYMGDVDKRLDALRAERHALTDGARQERQRYGQTGHLTATADALREQADQAERADKALRALVPTVAELTDGARQRQLRDRQAGGLSAIAQSLQRQADEQARAEERAASAAERGASRRVQAAETAAARALAAEQQAARDSARSWLEAFGSIQQENLYALRYGDRKSIGGEFSTVELPAQTRAQIRAQERAYEDSQKNIAEAARETGLVVESVLTSRIGGAISNLIDGSLNLRKLLQGIGADFLALAARQFLLKPALGALGDVVGGIGGFFGFAQGGVMSALGEVPLRRYSQGGVATSPQVAVFGEGRKPEAFVPLPDGRRIPVALEGGTGMGPLIGQLVVHAPGATAQTVASLNQQAYQLATMMLSAIERHPDLRRRLSGHG